MKNLKKKENDVWFLALLSLASIVLLVVFNLVDTVIINYL